MARWCGDEVPPLAAVEESGKSKVEGTVWEGFRVPSCDCELLDARLWAYEGIVAELAQVEEEKKKLNTCSFGDGLVWVMDLL